MINAKLVIEVEYAGEGDHKLIERILDCLARRAAGEGSLIDDEGKLAINSWEHRVEINAKTPNSRLYKAAWRVLDSAGVRMDTTHWQVPVEAMSELREALKEYEMNNKKG